MGLEVQEDKGIRTSMYKKNNTEFYREVDDRCDSLGINHKKLAEMIGLDEQMLSKYLTGVRKKIPLTIFMGIYKALDIKAEDLYEAVMRDIKNRVEKKAIHD